MQSRNDAGRLFRALQEVQTGTVVPFDAVLDAWTEQGSVGRLAILISDLLLDGWQTGVRRLVAAGGTVTVLHLLSPDELLPPSGGDFELLDSETGERLELHLGATGAAAYRERVTEWQVTTEAWCRRAGAHYCLVQSDWEVERVLLELLRRRGVVV